MFSIMAEENSHSEILSQENEIQEGAAEHSLSPGERKKKKMKLK